MEKSYTITSIPADAVPKNTQGVWVTIKGVKIPIILKEDKLDSLLDFIDNVVQIDCVTDVTLYSEICGELTFIYHDVEIVVDDQDFTPLLINMYKQLNAQRYAKLVTPKRDDAKLFQDEITNWMTNPECSCLSRNMQLTKCFQFIGSQQQKMQHQSDVIDAMAKTTREIVNENDDNKIDVVTKAIVPNEIPEGASVVITKIASVIHGDGEPLHHAKIELTQLKKQTYEVQLNNIDWRILKCAFNCDNNAWGTTVHTTARELGSITELLKIERFSAKNIKIVICDYKKPGGGTDVVLVPIDNFKIVD